MDVKTKLGARFLNLVNIHFSNGNRWHKILNKNTIKISYCTTPNVRSVIQNHNKRLLDQRPNDNTAKKCNCKIPHKCPLNGDCLQECVIYKATINKDNKSIVYIGSTEGPFKKRFYGHNSDFKIHSKENSTTLSAFVWNEKRENGGIVPEIKWEIIDKNKPYSGQTRKCNLCLAEKFQIMLEKKNKNTHTTSLNTRSEYLHKCPHQGKKMLSCVKHTGRRV